MWREEELNSVEARPNTCVCVCVCEQEGDFAHAKSSEVT